MRTFLLILLLIHGLIHLIGFVHEFHLATVRQLSGRLSVSFGPAGLRVLGVLWGLTTVLFLLAATLRFFEVGSWSIVTLLAILISQFLIILYWKDAKAGTAANILLLLLALPAWMEARFTRASEELKSALYAQATLFQPDTARLAQLPLPVQQWLRTHGAADGRSFRAVEIEQQGRMRTAQDGKWVPFRASQTVTCDPAAFQWNVRMEMGPGLFVLGRDRFTQGQGAMLIRLLGLVTLADARGPETDQGSLVRYLAEMVWYPAYALAPDVRWEPVDAHRARASLRVGDAEGSGIFTFDAQHHPVAFDADRYYDRKGTSTLEHWLIAIDPRSFQAYDGFVLPRLSRVSWKLKTGDFEWLQLELTGVRAVQRVPERRGP